MSMSANFRICERIFKSTQKKTLLKMMPISPWFNKTRKVSEVQKEDIPIDLQKQNQKHNKTWLTNWAASITNQLCPQNEPQPDKD